MQTLESDTEALEQHNIRGEFIVGDTLITKFWVAQQFSVYFRAVIGGEIPHPKFPDSP